MKALLIDDNQTDRELALRALKKLGLDTHIECMEDGAQALDFFSDAESKPEDCVKVIITDLKMPKISGLEVIKYLKSNTRTQHIPIIMFTSSAEDKEKLLAYQLGVNSFVVKPIGFDDFTQKIQEIGRFWFQQNRPVAC